MNRLRFHLLTITLILIFAPYYSRAGDPPLQPSIYANGPLSPFLSPVDLSIPELKAFSLLEGVMKLTEALIHSKGCSTLVSITNVDIYADEDNAVSNFVQVTSAGSSYTLIADFSATLNGFGDKIKVIQDPVSGQFDGHPVRDFNGLFKFNAFRNMVVGDSSVKIRGARGSYNLYAVNLIKDLYRGNATNPNDLEYYIIFDWGLQAVSKLGFPAHKYWHRSKSSRTNGLQGRTVSVSDRLVGPAKCRITLDTEGYNEPEFFFQAGTLKIESTVTPDTPIPEFSQPPFI